MFGTPKQPTRKPSLQAIPDYDDGWRSPLLKESCNDTVATADESECSSTFEAPVVEATRNVRFAPAVRRRTIESHRCYSKEERANCWYTSAEKEKRNTKMEKVIARMDAGKPEKSSRPYRGLEGWTEKGSAELEEQILLTLNAVMDEQDAQWEADVTDEDRIAALSRKATAASAQKALHVAFLDEKEAMAIRATMFDDINCVTDDDSTVGMLSVVAKKRSERRRKKKAEQEKAKTPRRVKKSSTRKKHGEESKPSSPKTSKKKTSKSKPSSSSSISSTGSSSKKKSSKSTTAKR